MGRGTALTYGKISLVSEGESLDSLTRVLSKILSEHGYPESKSINYDDEDDDELAENSEVDDVETEGDGVDAQDKVLEESEELEDELDMNSNSQGVPKFILRSKKNG
jgi:hypothetical protein